MDFVLSGKALKAPEKYYVGVTRPRYSIAFVMQKFPKTLSGYEEMAITCGNTQIRSLKYIVED